MFSASKTTSIAISLIFILLIGLAADAKPLKGVVIHEVAPQQTSDKPAAKKTFTEGTDIPITVNLSDMQLDALADGDAFYAKISRPVTSGGKVVIPRNSILEGSVTGSSDAKRLGRHASISVEFENLILPDGQEIPIDAKFTTKDSVMKTVGRNVVRGAGYSAAGGVVGGIMAFRMAGIAGSVASQGYVVAGGAAVGGTIGLTSALMKKGRDKKVDASQALTLELKEPLTLPVSDEPAVEKDETIPGLSVTIEKTRITENPMGDPTQLTLNLAIKNDCDIAFGFYDIALKDENGMLFYASSYSDKDLMFHKLKPGQKVNGRLSFNVDNPRMFHQLVFFKPNTREPVAVVALNR
ncbi:MAG: hypothetical protein KTR14_05690 [Vampirovibrio sp.]|nr:hypothetical protein [Vampirovibrio sp.]